ncbi:MAG: outer membrane protein assembly factor BamA, partial [Pseudomonadota bacterium]
MRLNKAVITSLILMSCSCSVYAADFVTPKPAEQNVAGSIIGAIKVQGNQRIENATVISYLNLKEGDKFSSSDIDAALKSIFATGFFSDAKIMPQTSSNGKVDLVVEVVENPIVDKIGFEGNDAVEEKDLQGELELKTRATYTKTKLQSDVKRILDIYRRGGRYSAQVTPKIIQLDQNRVDLVYEIVEGPVARVQKIAFIGNENFEADKLAKIIRTEESRWYKFLSSDDKYDPERLQYDQELLRRFYASEGFADFQVKSAIAELSPAKDAFYLTFAIEEGQKYNFGKVNIESALKGADISEVEKNLLTKPDTIYNATAVESSIDALTKELGNQGFAFVNIEPKLNRNPEQKIIDLTYDIKEGPRVYVEKINIIGNVRTLDEVVRRELRLAEGDPYSTAKISRSEQRLNNLGFFEKVKISSEQGTSPDKTVINVEIKEKSTGEISLGGGFST